MSENSIDRKQMNRKHYLGLLSREAGPLFRRIKFGSETFPVHLPKNTMDCENQLKTDITSCFLAVKARVVYGIMQHLPSSQQYCVPTY